MSREFTNGSGEWGSIPARVIPKTQKMALDPALLISPHYKVRISKFQIDGIFSLSLSLSHSLSLTHSLSLSHTYTHTRACSHTHTHTHSLSLSLFLSLINTRSGILVCIRWPVCTSKSQRILWISFPWTDSGLCIYHLVIWSNHLSRSPSPTQSYQIILFAESVYYVINRSIFFST